MKPCRHDAYEAVPKGNVDLDLDVCERMLKDAGYEIVSNAGVMLVVRRGVEVTLYPHGRLLLCPVKDKRQAIEAANKVFSVLGL